MRGTHDLLPPASRDTVFVEGQLRQACATFCYEEARTPILEKAEVFHKTLGQGSDVVSKEMYQFDDHGHSLVLRPEGTAGVARALSQQGAAQLLKGDRVERLFYNGPMFRRERPQKVGALSCSVQPNQVLLNVRISAIHRSDFECV